MRLRSLLVLGAAGILTLGIALPATALPSDALTPVELTVTGGMLAITAPSGPVTLSPNNGSAAVSSTSLGQMKVTDARSQSTVGWVASVISTPLVPILGGTADIPAAAIGYEIGSGGITKVGSATYVNTPAATVSLAGAVVVITASSVNLDNSATWTPDLKVTVPAGMAAGTYRATITHSLA